MNRFFNLSAAILSLVTLCSCASQSNVLNQDRVSGSINKGETFQIELKGNRTTGYEWVVISDGSPTLTLLGQTYLPDESNGRVGVGGTERIEFLAAQKGKAQVELTYKRAWEAKGVDTRRFNVDVQ